MVNSAFWLALLRLASAPPYIILWIYNIIVRSLLLRLCPRVRLQFYYHRMVNYLAIPISICPRAFTISSVTVFLYIQQLFLYRFNFSYQPLSSSYGGGMLWNHTLIEIIGWIHWLTLSRDYHGFYYGCSHYIVTVHLPLAFALLSPQTSNRLSFLLLCWSHGDHVVIVCSIFVLKNKG